MNPAFSPGELEAELNEAYVSLHTRLVGYIDLLGSVRYEHLQCRYRNYARRYPAIKNDLFTLLVKEQAIFDDESRLLEDDGLLKGLMTRRSEARYEFLSLLLEVNRVLDANAKRRMRYAAAWLDSHLKEREFHYREVMCILPQYAEQRQEVLEVLETATNEEDLKEAFALQRAQITLMNNAELPSCMS